MNTFLIYSSCVTLELMPRFSFTFLHCSKHLLQVSVMCMLIYLTINVKTVHFCWSSCLVCLMSSKYIENSFLDIWPKWHFVKTALSDKFWFNAFKSETNFQILFYEPVRQVYTLQGSLTRIKDIARSHKTGPFFLPSIFPMSFWGSVVQSLCTKSDDKLSIC